MLKEFREFALRGNAVDLAIGVITGAAFGAIVNSLVSDMLMPPIGRVLGGVDFSNFFLVLGPGQFPSLNYGVFLNTLINFLIIAGVMFGVVKGMNRLKREEPAPAPPATIKDCPFCATAIPLRATRCPHCTSGL